MLLQFYLMLASPSSLTWEVRVVFFEFHDGQASVRRALLSGDSSCMYSTTAGCSSVGQALACSWVMGLIPAGGRNLFNP